MSNMFMNLGDHITVTAAASAIRRMLNERKVSSAPANCLKTLIALSLIEKIIIEKHARRHTFSVSCISERVGLTVLFV